MKEIKSKVIDYNNSRYVLTYTISDIIKIELYDNITKSLLNITNQTNKLSGELLMTFKQVFIDYV